MSGYGGASSGRGGEGTTMPWNPSILGSEILAVHAALVPNGDEGEVVLFGGRAGVRAGLRLPAPAGRMRACAPPDLRRRKARGPAVTPCP